MKKQEIAALTAFILTIIFSNVTTFAAKCDTVRENSVRLHILANSDNEYDQEIKLKVRDRVLTDTKDMFLSVKDKPLADIEIEKNIKDIENIANAELLKENYPYKAKVEKVEMYFTTRSYGDFTMPAGKYDAIRISIGEAEGKNWWCVMYPPMCIPAAMDKENIDAKNILQLGQDMNLEPRFAVVELIEKFKNKDLEVYTQDDK